MEPSRETRSSVLVVNNDPAVRDMLANLLSGEGFHVALAESGAEAMKVAANAPFDTAIVDLFLPDFSGVEFKRRLARVSPKTRVVVLSSFTTIRSSDDVLRFGTSDFILDQGEIVELLHAVSAARPAAPKPPAEDGRLKKCLIDAIDVLVSLLEVNDPFFGGNSHITMEYARFVAEEMKLDREMVDEIVVGSLSTTSAGSASRATSWSASGRSRSRSSRRSGPTAKTGRRSSTWSTSRGRSSRSSSTTTSGTTGKGIRAASRGGRSRSARGSSPWSTPSPR